VQWKNPTVFAGDEIECTITFKNVATTHQPSRQPRAIYPNGNGLHSERSKRPGLSRTSTGSTTATALRSAHRPGLGHKYSNSLSAQTRLTRQTGASAIPETRSVGSNRHQRSLSVLSIGSGDAVPDDARSLAAAKVAAPTSLTERRTHGRTASLHIPPTGKSLSETSRTVSQKSNSPRSGSQEPLSPRQAEMMLPGDFTLSEGASKESSTPQIIRSATFPTTKNRSTSISSEFKFPMHSPGAATSSEQAEPLSIDALVLSNDTPAPVNLPSRLIERQPQVAKVLSAASINGGTPRSSGEFYSLSNHSGETLASEYAHPLPNRLSLATHSRQLSGLGGRVGVRSNETIMMGYTQIAGSFSLDGSLIRREMFEEVKRKAIVGGQGGGGVVGVETTKRDSTLFGSFGWGSISDSIGGLLGSSELSSIKEMRGMANSKAIPILSTPQSILFVNLELAPGESKSFGYSFRLPDVLPPSYKGRAIKVQYHLTIGTQRSDGSKGEFRQIDVPFRVLGGVDPRGRTPSYDLMSPYVILRDSARSFSLDETNIPAMIKDKGNEEEGSLPDFLIYVHNLLDKQRKSSSASLLSPTAAMSSRRTSYFEPPGNMQDSVDRAILFSMAPSNESTASNQFSIARNGHKVASLTLSRSAFRLGETISAVVDFQHGDVPVHAIRATLESSEKILNPEVALRSENSIHRVSRRVYASHAESTLYARRVSWTSQVPLTAAPEFITSDIALKWEIRVEFIVSSRSKSLPVVGDDKEEVEYAEADQQEGLLEEAHEDDRGTIFAAIKDLECDSFEVGIPIRVLGAVGSVKDTGLGNLSTLGELESPGLVV
jgi:hypothetical protein